MQVVRSDVSTSQGRVLDKFHLLGFDGRSIREARKAHIEAEVLAAIQSRSQASFLYFFLRE